MRCQQHFGSKSRRSRRSLRWRNAGDQPRDHFQYAYDATGNLREDDQGHEYTYDAWNRMIEVNQSDWYAYDPLGRRITEGEHTLVYSASWQVLEEQMPGDVRYQYVWSPVYVDALVARIESCSSGVHAWGHCELSNPANSLTSSCTHDIFAWPVSTEPAQSN